MYKYKVGIVIQGSYQNDYTYDNILKYLANSDVVICLSIWDSDKIDDNELIKLKLLDRLYMVRNKKPKSAGVQNVNYQLVSSLNGVQKLKKLGCEYIIKTRTDHSFNLEKLLDCNPNGKVIAFETDDLINSPFLVCDFLFYAQTEVMFNLLNIELSHYGDNRVCYKDDFENIHWYMFYHSVAKDFRFKLYAERYIVIGYFEQLGYQLPKNGMLLRLYSILLIVKHFVLISAKDIDYKSIKRYKALNYKGSSYIFYKDLIAKKKLVRLFLLVFKYEMIDFIRRILFMPKFLFQLWKIK